MAAACVPRFSSIAPLLYRSGPFAAPGYAVDPETFTILNEETRVLIVGAGGLGCEIIKNLALSGFTDLTIIDMDTIDVSNLNRQFLFRLADVNRSKAEVAAEVIRRRSPDVKVTAYNRAIQTFAPAFYKRFDLVIAGLDNVDARRWLNQTLIDLVEYDDAGAIDFATVIPFIDGGTEGFGGQARVFMPMVTSCFECQLQSASTAPTYPTCTIRNVPRLPEHTIVYALKVEWPLLTSFTSPTEYTMAERKQTDEDANADTNEPNDGAGAVTLDKDNADHMTWIYKRAAERAAKFNINGVTYALTMQVVKHIIPAIASTNAIIAAATTNEALKIRTNSSLRLNNYYMYFGAQSRGINSETIEYARNPSCAACQSPKVIHMSAQQSVGELLESLRLDIPSLTVGGQTVYVQSLHSQYQDNLLAPVSNFIKSGHICIVNDKSGANIKLRPVFNQ